MMCIHVQYIFCHLTKHVLLSVVKGEKKRNPTPPYFHNHNLNVRRPTRITHLLQSQPLRNLLPVSRPVLSDPIWRTETQHDGFIRLDTVTLIHTHPGSRLDRNRRKVGDRVLFTFITATTRTLATLSIINSLLSLKLLCVVCFYAVLIPSDAPHQKDSVNQSHAFISNGNLTL